MCWPTTGSCWPQSGPGHMWSSSPQPTLPCGSLKDQLRIDKHGVLVNPLWRAVRLAWLQSQTGLWLLRLTVN